MRLTSLDLCIISVYLIGVTLFGIAFRRGQYTVRDYFLGGRTAPWWALALSIVATETSTLTIIGTPALSFAGNLMFLQLVLGYLLGRVIIVLIFLPHYFRREYYTAYQIIERRFGAKTKAIAACTFLITRALAEGVRITAVALVIRAAFGIGQRTSVLMIVALVLIYTFEGGMKAVIWTDVVQLILYFAGSLVGFFLLLHGIPGGWEGVVLAAAAAHKLRVFDFSFSLTNPAKVYTFWSGVIGGAFLTMASHGTDQTIVQRLLAAKSERESKLALLASGGIVFFQFSLFLILGVMLYAWHRSPTLRTGQSYDWVFPDFIVMAMPSGLRGILIASILAVAMSNASGSLNSLAASTIMDFRGLINKTRPEDATKTPVSQTIAPRQEIPAQSIGENTSTTQILRLSRWATLFWGIGLVILGMFQWGPLLEAGLTIASITFGSLLGLFLLAFLLKQATSTSAIAGMFVGLAAMAYIHFFTQLLWTWYVLTGASITFLSGTLVTVFNGTQQRETR